jgi:hypothetical protein
VAIPSLLPAGSPSARRARRANSSGFHGRFINPSRTGSTLNAFEKQPAKDVMKSSGKNLVTALALVAIGVALAATGIYIGDTDDAPGAALMGIVLLIVAVVFSVRIARRQT